MIFLNFFLRGGGAKMGCFAPCTDTHMTPAATTTLNKKRRVQSHMKNEPDMTKTPFWKRLN